MQRIALESRAEMHSRPIAYHPSVADRRRNIDNERVAPAAAMSEVKGDRSGREGQFHV